MSRFTVETYDSEKWQWCVVDNQQTGSDGEHLIVGRYVQHGHAVAARDACSVVVHTIECDMGEDCSCEPDWYADARRQENNDSRCWP